MRSFTEVSDTIRETAIVISITLTFVFLLASAITIRSILNRRLLLDVSFIVGVFLFGVIGFFVFEITNRLSFLGGALKYGVAGFIVLILIGAALGGSNMVAFLCGTISGVTVFYLKSIYAIYYILMTETRQSCERLKITEKDPIGPISHYSFEGLGSNFELMNKIVEKLNKDKQVLYYARYEPKNTRISYFIENTIRFYANHLSHLHEIKSVRSIKTIKEIAFEATYLETMEKGLFNYWLRAYLSGKYINIIVPYMDDFVEKAAACENSKGDSFEIGEILGDSDFLFLMSSLSPSRSGVNVYSHWSKKELAEKISKIHPVD
ncbi:hypothetical protein GF326_07735 [Candidatus Bathyarchaeota archaeon]|nr:hypothetical protein [Candidatus Bathyarchaeota archaeon]